MKKFLSKIITFFPLKEKVQYFRFGYNPSDYLRNDLVNCFFGTKNLLKHFQAPDIIRALDIQPDETVLDFGCGAGYITVEISKLAAKTVGVDINPYIKKINIPDFLKDSLCFDFYDEFVKKQDTQFDKILLSEVILSVHSADDLLMLLRSRLRPNGKIILVNGLDRKFIKEKIYSSKNVFKVFRLLNSKIPDTYDEYEHKLCECFGNETKCLLSHNEIIELFVRHKFKENNYNFSPSSFIGNILEIRQFMCFPNMKSPNFFMFLFYRIIFSILKFWPFKYKSGFIAGFSRVN